ncbi:MAG: FKBP-type peptidyl-prolyl cis-trans isomerase [Gammaproteobacteria bacterium]|nr:FKBP-type peptidyl-prolyl cis-trans isomerase [Gammaproteobacteria bacterium]
MKSQLLAVALVGALSTSAFAETTLETDNHKLSYGLGMIIGERVLKNYGELDYDILLEAMKAQNEGADTLMTLEEAQGIMQAEQMKAAEEKASAAKAEGEKFLADNAARDGVTTTESGLQYEVLTAADDGAKPSIDDTVSVHYVGTLIDGTEFDSSIARGEPASFPLKGVIPGWTEGLQLMNLGSKFKFVIPSDLAYGDRGAGQNIGPGETLVFEVELLEIQAK